MNLTEMKRIWGPSGSAGPFFNDNLEKECHYNQNMATRTSIQEPVYWIFGILWPYFGFIGWLFWPYLHKNICLNILIILFNIRTCTLDVLVVSFGIICELINS